MTSIDCPYPSRRLSDLLGLQPDDLAGLARSASASYYRFPLLKRSGRRRWIDSPKRPLKACQRRILERLLYQAPVDDAAHGFVPGRSIVTNARCHERQPWVIAFDIHDFFPSIGRSQVTQVLEVIPGVSATDASVLGYLLTKSHVLPQGAPTSPCLANLVFQPMDRIFSKYAARFRLIYTRYADDLTFSGRAIPEDFEKTVETLLSSGGFRLNRRKTRKMGVHRRQLVTGLVVNDGVHLPRPFRRWIRAIKHDIARRGWVRVLADFPELTEDRLQGYLAFAEMVEAPLEQGTRRR